MSVGGNSDDTNSAFTLAAPRGDIAVLDLLLSRGLKPSFGGEDSDKAMHFAALYRDLAALSGF